MSAFFSYKAIDKENEHRNGVIEAASQDQAVKKLQDQGLIVISCEIVPNKENKNFVSVPWFLVSCAVIIMLVIFISVTFLKRMIFKPSDNSSSSRISVEVVSEDEITGGMKPEVVDVTSKKTRGSDNEEKELFERVRAENKIQSYKEFLKRFPEGVFSNDAQKLLEKRYGEGMKTCSDLIIDAASYCLKVCSGYSTIWSVSIESRYLDFSEQISSMQKELESKGILDEIKKTKLKLEEFMRKFIEPPPKYNESYKKLVELYGIYSQIYALAIQPTGSLMSFNSSVNDLQSQIIKLKSELDAMVNIPINTN